MRFKHIIAVAAVAAVALGMGACTKKDDTSTAKTFPAGSTMEKLNKAGAVTIGIKYDQPLFGLKGLDGKFTGFDVEIGKIIAAELGIKEDKITWKETTSKVREDAIINSQVDLVIATYTINDARKEKVRFAGPYYTAGQDILVRKGDTSITGPDSFKDGTKKVCSVTGSTPAKNIQTYLMDATTQLVLFDVYTKCLDALKQKTVDAVTTDNVILMGYVDSAPNDYDLLKKPFTKEPYGIGVKKDDKQFCDWINDLLEAAFKDGRYKKAWEATGSAGKVAPVPDSLTVNRY